jgi:hypothetical protein
VFAAPDRYAWTVYTTGDPLHHLLDGTTVRAFVGGTPTAEDKSPAAPLRSQARFVAVMLLQALRDPGARVVPLAAAALPADTVEGFTVELPDAPEPYTVLLDARARPVRVEGPIDLSPVGRGRMVAHQDDFRPVGGRLLAHRVRWELDGAELAVEWAVAVCVLPDLLPTAAFETPATLPACGPP